MARVGRDGTVRAAVAGTSTTVPVASGNYQLIAGARKMQYRLILLPAAHAVQLQRVDELPGPAEQRSEDSVMPFLAEASEVPHRVIQDHQHFGNPVEGGEQLRQPMVFGAACVCGEIGHHGFGPAAGEIMDA